MATSFDFNFTISSFQKKYVPKVLSIVKWTDDETKVILVAINAINIMMCWTDYT